MNSNPLGLKWIDAGIELTYVHPGETKGDNNYFIEDGKLSYYDHESGYSIHGGKRSYYGTSSDMKKVHDKVWDGPKGCLSSDPGCVEWSTPVLRSWKEAKAAWEYGHMLAEMFGLREEVEHLGGGMGHIHIACTDDQVIKAIKTDMFFRPYVAWAFCHPSAIHFCSPAYLRPLSVPIGLGIIPNQNLQTMKFIDVNITIQYPSSAYGTRNSSKTLEFRFFNSADSWEEQYRNLAFVQRYVQFMTEKVKQKRQLPCASAKHENWDRRIHHSLRYLVRTQYEDDVERCAREFKEFIEVLGLPFEDYESLINENLRPQFEWGKKGPIKPRKISKEAEMGVLHHFDLQRVDSYDSNYIWN